MADRQRRENEMCLLCDKDTAGQKVHCDRCNQWSHTECTTLKGVKKEVIKEITYYCDVCSIELQCMDKEVKELRETIKEMKMMMIEMQRDFTFMKDELANTSARVMEFDADQIHSYVSSIHNEVTLMKGEIVELRNKEKTNEIKNKLEIVTSELKNVANNIEEKKVKATYADTLKTKNMLIVKSAVDGKKASENKKVILGNIKTPVEAVNETKDGHLAVRFTSKRNLEVAKQELERENKEAITVSEKGKMKPKIKIVNVSKDDDDVIGSIKMKNEWIADLIVDDEDLIIKKTEQARNKKKMHYIIKCSPKIRKAIFDHGDKLYTKYENCNIYDSYQPFQCYKCQEFGHSAEKCNNNQVCPYCGDNHNYNDCPKTHMKCVNCEKKNLDSDHKSFDRQYCTLYIEEMGKIKDNTDHGFE